MTLKQILQTGLKKLLRVENKHERTTAVWQNGGFSAKSNIRFSNER